MANKPRLNKALGVEYWFCRSRDYRGHGETPLEAYEIWWLAGRDRIWLDRYYEMHSPAKGWFFWVANKA